MSEKPSISFGDNAKVDTFQTGENAVVVHGDQVTGDKIGNQVAGDNHGDMQQTNIGEGDYIAKCKELVGNLMSELETSEVDPVNSPELFAPLEPEFRPLSIMSTINDLADRNEPPSEAENESLRERLVTMTKRLSVYGRSALVKLGPIAVAGMRATASITPPWNIVCPVIEAAVQQFDDRNG